ncbi:Nucleoid-associated protein YejK [Raoultella planticola]|uniref:Nucleoid-associated protein YejK n=1 Tax=Raoultella planticola TaxID=575 RepID=A0A485AF34_RAOPL|nr:Nucleoid-associated protein YejK [Raoultella planticola]
MSLDIDQIALHQLIKRDEQNLELVLRDSLLEPNATVVEMMAELHRVYSAKNKAYGLFNQESELAQALRLQRQARKTFSRSAGRQPAVCVTNWRSILSQKAVSCCSVSIGIWR